VLEAGIEPLVYLVRRSHVHVGGRSISLGSRPILRHHSVKDLPFVRELSGEAERVPHLCMLATNSTSPSRPTRWRIGIGPAGPGFQLGDAGLDARQRLFQRSQAIPRLAELESESS